MEPRVENGAMSQRTIAIHVEASGAPMSKIMSHPSHPLHPLQCHQLGLVALPPLLGTGTAVGEPVAARTYHRAGTIPAIPRTVPATPSFAPAPATPTEPPITEPRPFPSRWAGVTGWHKVVGSVGK